MKVVQRNNISQSGVYCCKISKHVILSILCFLPTDDTITRCLVRSVHVFTSLHLISAETEMGDKLRDDHGEEEDLLSSDLNIELSMGSREISLGLIWLQRPLKLPLGYDLCRQVYQFHCV